MTIETLFQLAHESSLAQRADRLTVRKGDGDLFWASVWGERAGGFACAGKTPDAAFENLKQRIAHHAKERTAPADPQPAHPAPSDWRGACKVVKCAVCRWDVISPCGKFYLCGREDDPKWEQFMSYTSTDKGVYYSESDARDALSIAPVPPGVGQ